MDAVIEEGHTMQIVSESTKQAPSFLDFIKGIAGFSVLALCFIGACAAVLRLPYAQEAQLGATVLGAIGGALIVWCTRFPSAHK